MGKDMQEDKPSRIHSSKLRCPVCGGRLESDKHPFVSERGFIYRDRTCLSCHAKISTKQGKEEVTHIGNSVKVALQ